MSSTSGVHVHPRFATIYLDDVTAKSPTAVEMQKNECLQQISNIREKLAMLIAGNPKDLMSQYDLDEASPQTWISLTIDELEEEFKEVFTKYERLCLLDTILYEWEEKSFHYDNSGEWSNIYPDIDFSKKDNIKLAFPEDIHLNDNLHYDILMGKKQLDDHSLDEMYNNCKNNFDAENYFRNLALDNVCATVDGKLFVTYTGQWVFKSEEDAFNAIKAKLNISKTDYVNSKFIDTHKEFFEDVMNWVSDEDKEVIKLYIGKSDEESLKGNYELLTEFYNRVSAGIDNYLKSKIKFYKILDILDK